MATLVNTRKTIKIESKERVFRNSRSRQTTRDKEKFKKFMMQLFELTALTLFLTAIYHMSLSHPMFKISTIKSEGIARLSHGDILKMVAFLDGKNIFLSDTERAERVLQKNRWIESATVNRVFPSSLTVSIVERTPALVALKGGREYLTDISGFVIEEISSASGYLKVIGIEGSVRVGRTLSRTKGLSKALKLKELFELDTLFHDSVAMVDLSNSDRLIAYTYSGIGVAFGFDLENLEEKFLEYLTVRKILVERGEMFKAIDLSFKGEAVVKLDVAQKAKSYYQEGVM